MVTVEKKRRETGNCRLTDPKVKNAKPSEDAKTKGQMTTLRDGDGLELRISAAGSKLWAFKYSKPSDNKRTNMSFGTYPEVSLGQARELLRKARALLAQGIDPKPKQCSGRERRSTETRRA